MTGRLENKIAIITGGATGFGAGIVEKFITEGAKVVIVDIDEAGAREKAASYPNNCAVALRGDVSTEYSWMAALDAAVANFGGLDIVVNNAGVVHKAKSSIEVSEEDYDRMFNINVKQIYWSTKVVIPYFTKNEKAGLFINISSMSAPRPRPNLVWYAASKGAVNNATKGLAIEWAKDNIRFNAICPAAGETNMVPLFLGQPDTPEARKGMLATIPLGRFATPADIGNSACYLASDEASYLTGVCLEVDGGRGI